MLKIKQLLALLITATAVAGCGQAWGMEQKNEKNTSEFKKEQEQELKNQQEEQQLNELDKEIEKEWIIVEKSDLPNDVLNNNLLVNEQTPDNPENNNLENKKNKNKPVIYFKIISENKISVTVKPNNDSSGTYSALFEKDFNEGILEGYHKENSSGKREDCEEAIFIKINNETGYAYGTTDEIQTETIIFTKTLNQETKTFSWTHQQNRSMPDEKLTNLVNQIQKVIPKKILSWLAPSYLCKTILAALIGFVAGTLEGQLEERYPHLLKNDTTKLKWMVPQKQFPVVVGLAAPSLFNKSMSLPQGGVARAVGVAGSIIGMKYGPDIVKKAVQACSEYFAKKV